MKKIFFALILLFCYTAKAQTPNFEWAKQIGGENVSNSVGRAITTDLAGNVYSIGTFTNTVDFDPDPDSTLFITTTGTGFFVSKFNSEGELIWVKAVKGGAFAYGIALDAVNNIYITGHYLPESVDFDPDPDSTFTLFTNHEAAFILKLNSAGDFVWVKQFKDDSGFNFSYGLSITIDSKGDVYATGFFQGTINFNPVDSFPSVRISATRGGEIFVLKLDSTGNLIWAKSIGGIDSPVSPERKNAIAVDKESNVYTTGFFDGTADFDPNPDSTYFLTSEGDFNVYVSKLDSMGNFVWAKQMGGHLEQ